jgi:cyanophycinase
VSRPSPDVHERGAIVAIGGAEDKMGDREILRHLVVRAGGRDAVIALFPAASQAPREMEHVYRQVFESMGAEVRSVNIRTRADACDANNVELLNGATAAFFTGGAQGRVVSLIGGTPLAQAVRRAHRSGMLVAGTSAGASVMCQHMIAQGRSGYAPRRHSVTLAPGLGLTKKLVIDQHFAQRHRIGRLFAAVALNPFLIGVGIDENTAIVLEEPRMEVIGKGTVTVIDGSRLRHTDIHETPPSAPAAVLGLEVHVLTGGCSFDVHLREPRWPVPTELALAPPSSQAPPESRGR